MIRIVNYTLAVILAFAMPALAQNSDPTALEIAQGQNACGESGSIRSATFLNDGLVSVQCERNSNRTNRSSNVSSDIGSGLTSGTALAGIFTLVLTAAAIGGGSSSTSDTQ